MRCGCAPLSPLSRSRLAVLVSYPFVGVGSRDRAGLLRNAGANAVVENFLNYERCMMYFDHAEVPKIQ